MTTTGVSTTPGDVLQLIVSGQARTRNDVMRLTGLSRSTVAERLEVLFDANLLQESTAQSHARGRPSRIIQMNRGGRVVAGVDVGEDHVRVCLFDLGGHLIADLVGAVRVNSGPRAVIDWVGQALHELVAKQQRSVDDLLGIGCSVPAPVDFDAGRVVGPSVMTGWEGVDIIALVHSTLRNEVPVLIENDVNARGVGEFELGWQGHDQIFYVKAGTGIGSAILSDGRVFRGVEGAAGDIGHIRLEPEHGPLCRCGNVGCVESMAAGWALVRDLQAAGFNVESTRDVIELVRSNQPEAVHALREAGRVLGRAIAYCVSLLNPGVIIIGGSLAETGGELISGIRESVYQYSLPLATRHLEFAAARGNEYSGARGAARLMIDRILSPVNVNLHVQEVLGR